MQGKMWAFLRMAIVLCLMMPAGLSSAPRSTAAAVPQTFRVLTYNVQFRRSVPPIDDDKIYNLSDDQRAGLIAKRVIAENYDVVAFQEVFDNSARDVLTSRLASAGYQGGDKFADALVAGDDSGLALYTKLPVQLMSIPVGRDADCRDEVTTASGTRCRVAFYRYRDRSGADGTRVATGPVLGGTTTVPMVLPAALPAGRYWPYVVVSGPGGTTTRYARAPVDLTR